MKRLTLPQLWLLQCCKSGPYYCVDYYKPSQVLERLGYVKREKGKITITEEGRKALEVFEK